MSISIPYIFHSNFISKSTKTGKNYWLVTVSILVLLSLFSLAASATTNVSLSRAYGGNGGAPFVDMMVPGSRVSAVTIKSGKFIDNIKFIYVYKNSGFGSSHGGNGGGLKTLTLSKGEYIIEFGGRYGKLVDSIYIKTSNGNKMSWGGTGGERAFRFRASKKVPIIGIWGRAGKFVDAIGVINKTSSGNNSVTAQGKLNDFNPKEQSTDGGDCGSCDSVTSAYFPRPPRSDQEVNYWKVHLERLGHSISGLSDSVSEYKRYLEKETDICSTNLHCKIDFRSRAISFVVGAE